jgi:CHC2 zinc finger
MDTKGIRECLQCEAVARAALGEPRPGKPGDGPELFWKCSQHNDEHPSLQVNPKKNAWMCGPCGASGNAWELAAFVLGKGCKYERLNEPEKKEVTDWLQTHGLLTEKANPGHEASDRRRKEKADHGRIVKT